MTSTLSPLPGTTLRYHRLDALREAGLGDPSKLPFTVKILLENLLREQVAGRATDEDIRALTAWPATTEGAQLPFTPARVLLQDFTGVPAVVDLAAMRGAMQRAGKDPRKIDPLVQVDLVVDHSVQVDAFGSPDAYARNLDREFERNGERYALFRWAQQAFGNFRVVPPGMGICHQVNLERLSRLVQVQAGVAIYDTLVGADSHTTMVNGLGIFGWGVGGIEAEAAMLGQPMYLPAPVVIGVRPSGSPRPGTPATDLVLTLTELFRKHGVVDKFVEFCGAGLSSLSIPDRATLSNMCPDYGATAALFPADERSLEFLEATGRGDAVPLARAYLTAQGLFRTDASPTPVFSELIEFDLGTVEPSLAGPKRPQDRVGLAGVRGSFEKAAGPKKANAAAVAATATKAAVTDGSVVLAAITSCTNTSNPSVMVAAGLLAKRAVERGLRVPATVKPSLAPGSRVVTRYLDAAGLTPYLEKLGFNVVGYGCTTCIAEGTPVSLTDGTSRRIEQLHQAGADMVFSPTADRTLAPGRRIATFSNGTRECSVLVLQDGRELTCTPDHLILRSDGSWIPADQLRPGEDRVLVGIETPLDEPRSDELGYEIRAGRFTFAMGAPRERRRTLAFARLLGHLLDDGSVSALGQGRMNVGQAMDRAAVLDDIELVTGKRPAATRYDARKWTIVLPAELTEAIIGLDGVRVGRRIEQPPALPAFLSSEICPVSVIREFLAGMFGADGHAPVLHRHGSSEEEATFGHVAYSHAVRPEHVARQREVMGEILQLLARGGVRVEGAKVYEYSVRRSDSSYPVAQDGIPRMEVRLQLPHSLSFVENIGFRYCIDKTLRASAAAVYWRLIEHVSRQRLWMSERLSDLHEREPQLSFGRGRAIASVALTEREVVLSQHYALLEGYDRFSRLPSQGERSFRPLHRKTAAFPTPIDVLREIGAREWFAPLSARDDADYAKHYCIDKDALQLPTLALKVVDTRPAGEREVFDLTVDDHHAFVAGTVAVHNCIGNSGPLASAEVEAAVTGGDLNVVAVLSGNRNFEGRVHPLVRSSYLASPPLVVAYALAGTVLIDLTTEPLGTGKDGAPVFLKDIWPSPQEVTATITASVHREQFEQEYGRVFTGDLHWQGMKAPVGPLYTWDPSSTYVQEPPFFRDLEPTPEPVRDIVGARALVVVGDSITTDHISPAGGFSESSPAGRYLAARGVAKADFNQYGTRRGDHEVLMRGTFANIRLRNKLTPEREGAWTVHLPDGEEMSPYDAAMRYRAEGTPLIVIAGKEYGTGSSRDWAAKGPSLLGVRAVIAESFERIHRSNLVGMGILPCELLPGETPATLGLTGRERFTIRGLAAGVRPKQLLDVEAERAAGTKVAFRVRSRIDNPTDVEYLRHGGVLQMVVRQLLA